MKIISCASYYGTGSSAISDLFEEFDNVKSMSNFEFRFLYDPDGVSDLEFNIVQNFNRHNSGHSIKRFEKLAKFNAGKWFNSRYEPYFNNNYMKITNKYIDSIVNFEYDGYWLYDMYDKGIFSYYLLSFQDKLLKKFFGKKSKGILKNETTYACDITEKQFLQVTQDYTEKLFMSANSENKEYIMVDQLLPSSNIERYLRYLKDAYVIVVDRDPRDVYLLEKFVWKSKVLPTDVKEYCKWFKYVRQNGKKTINNKIMYIQFEDLIYNYNETLDRLLKFTGIKNECHIEQFKKLNPKKSINNTRLWEKFDDKENINYIEEELKDFLYPFEQYQKIELKGLTEKRIDIF